MDWPNLTVVLGDEKGGMNPPIVFEDEMDVDQELPVSEAWASGNVIGPGRRVEPTGKYRIAPRGLIPDTRIDIHAYICLPSFSRGHW